MLKANDCIANAPDPAYNAAETLLNTMGTDGVEKVLNFFYPDPYGSQWASLKSCLDGLRPSIQALCEGLTSPKCYSVDLRESWGDHTEYAPNDGIHPSAAGDQASAGQIWPVMVENCIAQ
jgi:lysophospholipase L1-like esterase